MSAITEITTEQDFNTHLSALPKTTLVVLSFHTPWAAPCAQMSTVLRTLASSYPSTSPPTTSWLSVNAEELPDISEVYDVNAVPFLVLIRSGKVLETVSGSDAVKVRSTIEKHARGTASGKRDTELPPAQIINPRHDLVTPALAPKDSSTYAPKGNDPALPPQMSPAELAGEKEDLHKRLGGLVKAAPVMLFMKGTPSSPQCGFSRQLVGLLREKGVRYGFFNILADDEVRQGLKEYADWPTYPQLWVDGELLGGLDIVKEEIASDPEFLNSYKAKSNGGLVTASS